MFKVNNKDTSVFIVNFENVIAGWEELLVNLLLLSSFVL